MMIKNNSKRAIQILGASRIRTEDHISKTILDYRKVEMSDNFVKEATTQTFNHINRMLLHGNRTEVQVSQIKDVKPIRT